MKKFIPYEGTQCNGMKRARRAIVSLSRGQKQNPIYPDYQYPLVGDKNRTQSTLIISIPQRGILIIRGV